MLLLLAILHVAQAAPDLTGSWGLEMQTTVAAKLPVIGDLRTTSTTRILIQLTPDGDQWTAHHEVCQTQTNSKIVKTEIPDTYIAAIPKKTYPVNVDSRAGVDHFALDMRPFFMGFDPATCGSPPEDPDSPCLVDADSDGHPGVTIRVRPPLFSWMEVYVAQTSRTLLDGVVVNGSEIAGTVEVRDATTTVLGATRSMFAHSPKTRILQDESAFVMKRIKVDATCADVRQ